MKSQGILKWILSGNPDFTFIFIIFSVARTCSVIFIVLDVLKPLQHKRLLEYELEGFGIRLNKKPPNIGYKKKDKGGLNLTATVRNKRL